MQFDALFRGVGKDLVELFGSSCTYHQQGTGAYDPLSGVVTAATTDYAVKVGVEQVKRVEEGGSSETREATMWFSHVLLPLEPTTADTVTYQGSTWKVTSIDPQFSGDQLIAWKLTARSA
jgi:hypothetical protein